MARWCFQAYWKSPSTLEAKNWVVAIWFYNERQVAMANCGDVEDYPI